MFNIANLLEGLEKLIFEVLMWVVFVPKTLIKTLWAPDWAPHYIEEELSKKEGRFSDYVSPLLLLILIVVGLYGVIESLGRFNLMNVNWPQTAKVGDTTTFTAEPKFRWQDSAIVEIWHVDNMDTKNAYRLIRYNPNRAHLIDTDKLIAKYGDSFGTEIVVDIIPEIPSHSFEYIWQEPGNYQVTVLYFSSQGEAAGNFPHGIHVSGDGGGVAPQPDVDRNGFQEIATVFESREQAFSVALIGLILPVWLALGTELMRRKPLTRTGLQHSLYVHCLYAAPLVMVFLMGALATIYRVPVRDWIKAETHLSRTIYAALAYINIVIFLWFLVVEMRFFKREFNQSIWLSGLFTAIMLYIPYRIYRFIETSDHRLVSNSQVFWFGLYIVPHILILLGIVFLKAFPDIWKWAAQKIFKRKSSQNDSQ